MAFLGKGRGEDPFFKKSFPQEERGFLQRKRERGDRGKILSIH